MMTRTIAILFVTLVMTHACFADADNTASAQTVGQPTQSKTTSNHPHTTLVFSTFNAYTLSLTVSAILEQAYDKLGIETQTRNLPGERALLTANAGKVDGELFRIKGMVEKYPNLIAVPVPLIELQTMAYSRDVDIKIDGWSSLQPYKLGFLRSFQKAEQHTRGMQTYRSDDLLLLFKLLDKGRLDIVVESRIGGEVALDSRQYPQIKRLEPPIDRIKIYHYLHKKHQALVPVITNVLKDMVDSGEITQIIEQTIIKIRQSK